MCCTNSEQLARTLSQLHNWTKQNQAKQNKAQHSTAQYIHANLKATYRYYLNNFIYKVEFSVRFSALHCSKRFEELKCRYLYSVYISNLQSFTPLPFIDGTRIQAKLRHSSCHNLIIQWREWSGAKKKLSMMKTMAWAGTSGTTETKRKMEENNTSTKHQIAL